MHDHQRRIPGDIAIVGFDEMPWASLSSVSLTTVTQPAYELGSTAAARLFQRLHHPDSFTRQEIVLAPALFIRGSSGAVGWPVAAGGLVTTLLLTLILNWGEYIFALVLTRSDMETVPVRLSDYFSEATGLQWGPQAALALMATAPIVVIAIFIQRYLVRAMAFGAVKGYPLSGTYAWQ